MWSLICFFLTKNKSLFSSFLMKKKIKFFIINRRFIIKNLINLGGPNWILRGDRFKFLNLKKLFIGFKYKNA
jgi:hypothetical protein